MSNPRTKARIEARIRERVAYCVEFELNDPRSAFITITKVEVTSDLGRARIFFSVYGSSGDKNRVQHMLQDATGFVRRQVGRVLRLRRIPRLDWVYDDTLEFQEEMEKKISAALEHDRLVNPDAHKDLEPDAGTEETVQGDAELEYLDFLDAQDEEELGS